MARKKLVTHEILIKDRESVMTAWNNALPLEAVIVTVAYIEQHLGAMLTAFLVESSTTESLLNSMGGAVGSLAARNDLAYSLGLIPKTVFQITRKLGEIRNVFAHSHVPPSFENVAIQNLLSEIKLPHGYTVYRNANERARFIGEHRIGDEWHQGFGESKMQPRDVFKFAASWVISVFEFLNPTIARRQRVQEEVQAQ